MDGDLRLLAVTSAVPDEGKTTASVALARAAASSGRRTLLVECDLRRPSLAGALGVHPQARMFALLSGWATPSEGVCPAGGGGHMWFLDAEPQIPSPGDVLDSDGFAALLGELRRSWDLVVLDTPPVCAFADAVLVAGRADAALMMVREGLASRDELAFACGQLEKAGARILGVVANGFSR